MQSRQCAAGSDRLEEAIASYDRAVELQPDLAQAFFNRGMAFEEMERFDAALQSYGRALEIEPDDADVRLNEALCRLLLGDFGRGCRTIREPLDNGGDAGPQADLSAAAMARR